MKIKINKQNNTVTINEVITLPMDGKISIEFEEETLNVITGDKIGDIVGGVVYDNTPPNTIPCTTTDDLIGHSVTLTKNCNKNMY